MNKETRYETSIKLVFALILFVAFMPLLSNDFINYDDQSYVTRNQYVRKGWSLEGIKWAFKTTHAYNWHPLTWVSHMLDVQLYGLTPKWHHLTNLLLHIANSLLLFSIFKQMTEANWRSLCVASLFALHPLHVESVAWVAERKDVLSTLFELLAFWAYVRYARSGKTSHYVMVLLFFLLGLMAKPMLVTFPFVLMLLDYWPLGRLSGDRQGRFTNSATFKEMVSLLREKVPLFILSIASSAVTYYVQVKGGAINSYTPLHMNVGNALISYVKYIAKTFWPHPLAVIYPFNPDEITSFWVGGAVALLALTSFFVFRPDKDAA